MALEEMLFPTATHNEYGHMICLISMGQLLQAVEELLLLFENQQALQWLLLDPLPDRAVTID